jgi:hypothetical protein
MCAHKQEDAVMLKSVAAMLVLLTLPVAASAEMVRHASELRGMSKMPGATCQIDNFNTTGDVTS